MFHLITGGSGSGKSEYAEKKICRYLEEVGSKNMIYVATMFPYGDETQAKIERHRQMRAGKGFKTIECYTNLLQAAKKMAEESADCILLECISNLTANELYLADKTKEEAITGIVQGVEELAKHCKHLIVVTNEVCSEGVADTKELERYKKVLGRVNCALAAQADHTTEVVYGIATAIVGENEQKVLETEKTKMKMIIGGAFQGKLAYGKRIYPTIEWINGSDCEFNDIEKCKGIYNFQEYIKRMLEKGQEAELMVQLQNLSQINSELVIISDEVGYGLVPAEKKERYYREQIGRICTELATKCEHVERVVCGVSMILK